MANKIIRLKQRYIREQNRLYSEKLVEIPQSQWEWHSFKPAEVWRSSRFLVQIFPPKNGAARMSVNRTLLADDGRWMDGITWDDLLRLKSECGHGDDWAVELFPPNDRVVNVANMRHLWLIPTEPDYAWKRGE